jgi:energy-coupling factor transporter transmembrane protein EcfT
VAELSYAYRPGRSALHRLDARLKLLLALLASAAVLHACPAGVIWAAVVLAVGAVVARLRLDPRSGEMRWLGIFLAFVFAARAVSTDGEAVFTTPFATVTADGLREAGTVCLRLALAYLIGALVIATTRSAEIRTAVRWFLKPVPIVPAERVATMLGLMVRFVPMVMEASARTSEAQRARAVENRGNPVLRLGWMTLPLMRRVIVFSDRLVLAMEARCFTEDRTWPALETGRRDWLVFAAACAALTPAFVPTGLGSLLLTG